MPDQKQEEFLKLVAKYLDGNASPKEIELLDQYYELFRDEPDFTGRLSDKEKRAMAQRMEDRLFARINPVQQQPTRRLWPRIAAAASIIAILSVSGYFLLHHKQPVTQVAKNQTHDIAPGHNQATLILANGKKIILTKGLQGQLAIQGNTIIQANNNAIAYNASGATQQVAYNTLTTKRGEQSPYPLVLSDGTKVWLNAASSITFPTAFNSKDREVRVIGEAYFEVAHNAAQPFKVLTANQTIEDIGTAFDLVAYEDEPAFRTTLLQGSVSVNGKILKPGEQGLTKAGATSVSVSEVNTEEAVAWRKGYFYFNDEPIQSVMRKISRWYDVEVVYPAGGAPNETFGGTANRYGNVSQVLKALEMTSAIRFRIDGHKIYVLDK